MKITKSGWSINLAADTELAFLARDTKVNGIVTRW